jgi:hypothetical protein
MAIPMTLSNDTNLLINLASENNGYISFTLCYEKLNINKNRFDNTIVNII